MRHKEQRVLVLFDVQNMYYSAKHLYNTKVDFRAILNEAVSFRKLIRAIGYVIKTEIKEEYNFHDALNNIGIEVKSKDLQIFHGGSKKGDWDIGIAMDAVRMVNKIDTLVLVSGDGDFKDLLEYMKAHGCRTEVMALGRTSSKQLKECADHFIDLEENVSKYLIGVKKNFKNQNYKSSKKQKIYNQSNVNHQNKKINLDKDKKIEQKPIENKSKDQLDILSSNLKKTSTEKFEMPIEKKLDEVDFDIYDSIDEEINKTKEEVKQIPNSKKTKKKSKKQIKTSNKKESKEEKTNEKKINEKETKDDNKEKGGFAKKLKKLIGS
ncbi:MAG: NYN domain-containing protein [Candidatus Woesearchaeota archaeon]